MGEFVIFDVFYGDMYEVGCEEIYWRLVCFNVLCDIGGMYVDKWFYDVMGMDDCVFVVQVEIVKIWILIYLQLGCNGFMIVFDLYCCQYCYYGEFGVGGMKLIIDEDFVILGVQLMFMEFGNMFIFNEGILYGGVVNLGDQICVSVEIMLVFL